jgi:RimJ/RimL family protein N-acetyltransferase
VRTTAAGKGVASKASRLVARFGFEEVGLQRIEVLAAVSNIPSQRVAEKIGAVREAVLRKRLLIGSASHDAVMFSLVAEDLQS